MLPFTIGALASTGATVIDYALGRPLHMWGRSIDADAQPAVRSAGYGGNEQGPNVLPSPDSIIEAMRRGLVSYRTGVELLSFQGVAYGHAWSNRQTNANWGSRLPLGINHKYAETWNQIGKMRRSRPDPSSITRAWMQGRLTRPQWDDLVQSLDFHADLYGELERSNGLVPGIDLLLRLRRLGKITPTDYYLQAQRLGWYDSHALALVERETPLPTMQDLLRLQRMGRLQPGEYSRYMNALGHTDTRTRELMETSWYETPSPSDLVRFAVREVWDNAVVQRWGYDEEFPEPFRYWMRTQGMDWSQQFTGDDGRIYPPVRWPVAYWRAHWQPIPPGLAYLMYQRFRPDQMGRYQEISPGVQPFSLAHLNDVLKIQDYPPQSRRWLAALAHSPLRLVDIRNALKLGLHDRAWAIDRMLDRGLVRADAETSVDLAIAQNEAVQNRWRTQIETNLNRQTLREILAGYADGLVPRETAVDRIRDLGIDAGLALRLLSLEDSRQLRQTLRESLRAMRRDYLAGTLADDELRARLQQMRVASPQATRLYQRWTIQRGLERRALSSAQVGQMVAAGALDAPTGLARLANLGWSSPDAALLVRQATAKLQLAQARARQQASALEQNRRKQLEIAARQAASALRTAQGQLRSTTPRSVLQVWYQKGIRKESWIRQRLSLQGYDTDAIDAYLSQWASGSMEQLASMGLSETQLQKALKRQTSQATVKRWYQYGIVSRAWAERRLNDSGYTPETIRNLLTDWTANLPRGAPGPTKG